MAPTQQARLGEFDATIPQSWAKQDLTSDTQMARYRVTAKTELVVLAGGEYEVSGIDWFQRWRDGFQSPNPRVIEVLPGPVKTRLMRVTGSWFDPATNTMHTRHAMIVALVESRHDRHYFKLLGPRAEVAAQEAAFRAMLASLKPS